MNCQEFEELSGAYALDAVTPEERAAADEHLAHCPQCRRRLQELLAVVDLLPLATPQVEPSAAVQERLLATIQADTTTSKQVITQRYAPPPIAAPRRLWQRWDQRLLVAVACLFLLLSGGMAAWNISLQRQINTLSTATVAPPTVYALQGASPRVTITGEVTYFSRQQQAVVILHGPTGLQGTEIYQGWLLQGKQPRSIGVFKVQNDVAILVYHGDLNGYDAAAVSLEAGPQATANAPRGPILLLGAFKHI